MAVLRNVLSLDDEVEEIASVVGAIN